MLGFWCRASLLVPLCLALGFSQQAAAPLSVVTESLPPALIHQQYRVELKANGGMPPLQWKISRGNLPDGLELDSSSGIISGVPAKPEELQITLSVIDSVGNTISHDYKIKVVAPLLIDWSNYPRAQGDQILGSVKVSNGTKDNFDLTVVILAVNEYGKAFALGYQHFDLQPETVDLAIPFGTESNLPFGTYVVHADAVAEVAENNTIFRGRKQTPEPLRIVPVP